MKGKIVRLLIVIFYTYYLNKYETFGGNTI